MASNGATTTTNITTPPLAAQVPPSQGPGAGANAGQTSPEGHSGRVLDPRNRDPDALESAEKDEQITNIFYYLFFGILFLIALIILINCIVSLVQHKIQEREEELIRNERARQAVVEAGNDEAGVAQGKPCAPGGYVPGLTFQPRGTGKCKCKTPHQRIIIMPTRRDYINHLDSV